MLELIDCEKLQGFEVINKDQKDNIVPLVHLASLSVLSCPNVTQMYGVKQGVFFFPCHLHITGIWIASL